MYALGVIRYRDDDPFVKNNLAQYELLSSNVVSGRKVEKS